MAADRAATLFMERNMTDKERLPRHVAVIMDGNGRWAQKNKVSRLAGHNAGMLAMKEIIKRADVLGIKYLTVYMPFPRKIGSVRRKKSEASSDCWSNM